MHVITAPTPATESERLASLQQYEILDTGAEASFDAIVELAAQICQAPIALVSLVDKNRQWFKAKKGLSAQETSRDIAFCSHAILQSEPLIIENALQDERFKDNPLVSDGPLIRFYAGAPLITPDGQKLGTLCVIDTEPRKLAQHQIKAIETLSQHVIHLMELRSMYQKSITLNQELIDKNAAMLEMSEHNKRFLANINHEMRTPLNAISGFSKQLIKRISKLELPDYVSEGLDSIQVASKHLHNLISDVLDLSKIDADKVDYMAKPFNPHHLLKEVVSINSVEAEKNQVNLQLEINENLPENMLGDEQKIAQVLINVLSNAVKFTPENKSVTLRANVDGLNLVLQVTDQGVGIEQQNLDKNFQEFEQIANELSARSKGTGLGLSIAKRLVTLMGGNIEVDSELGKGTCFTISIPTQDFQAIAPYL